LGAFRFEERIYPSEEALLTDRGVDAIRVKCGSVGAIKPFLTREKIQKGSCHAPGNEGEECYYEPSANPTYNDMVGNELRRIKDLIQGAMIAVTSRGGTMSRLYGPQHRQLPDQFDSRRMADRIELIAVKPEIDDPREPS